MVLAPFLSPSASYHVNDSVCVVKVRSPIKKRHLGCICGVVVGLIVLALLLFVIYITSKKDVQDIQQDNFMNNGTEVNEEFNTSLPLINIETTTYRVWGNEVILLGDDIINVTAKTVNVSKVDKMMHVSVPILSQEVRPTGDRPMYVQKYTRQTVFPYKQALQTKNLKKEGFKDGIKLEYDLGANAPIADFVLIPDQTVIREYVIFFSYSPAGPFHEKKFNRTYNLDYADVRKDAQNYTE